MCENEKQDSILIQEILSGDGQAFNVLIRRYQKNVYALVWSLVQDFASAEDITQEAFLMAFQKLRQLQDSDLFPPWLRRIAVNAARMHLRKESRQEIKSDLEPEKTHKKNSHNLQEEVKEILTSLPEKKRQVAMLCYMEDLSRKAAAQFLSISETALRKRLHDTKRILQKKIVEKAEASLKEHLLPRDFARRCICACERSIKNKMEG